MTMPDGDSERALDLLEARIAREEAEDAASPGSAQRPEIVTFEGFSAAGVPARAEPVEHRRNRRGRR